MVIAASGKTQGRTRGFAAFSWKILNCKKQEVNTYPLVYLLPFFQFSSLFSSKNYEFGSDLLPGSVAMAKGCGQLHLRLELRDKRGRSSGLDYTKASNRSIIGRRARLTITDDTIW